MTNGSYVYLLSDPDKVVMSNQADPTVFSLANALFYVGKGTAFRALAHEVDAQEAAEQARAIVKAGSSNLDAHDISVKLQTIQRILKEKKKVRIDVLANEDGSGLPDSVAFGIEAGLIAALGMKQHGNVVASHHIRLLPANAFSRMAAARPVTVPEKFAAIMVPVNGIWGGQDYTGGLADALEQDRWDNARRLWSSFRGDIIRTVQERADSKHPVVLIALGAHPDRQVQNFVVGVYALRDIVVTEEQKGSGRPGYALIRTEPDEESADVTALRAALLHQILTRADGSQVRRPQDRAYLQGL